MHYSGEWKHYFAANIFRTILTIYTKLYQTRLVL